MRFMLLNCLKYPERDLSLSQGKQLPFSHFTVSHVASVFNNLAPTPWRCAVSRFPRPALSQPLPGLERFCFVLPFLFLPGQGSMETGVCTRTCGADTSRTTGTPKRRFSRERNGSPQQSGIM